MITLDTHSIVKDLIAAGISEKAAEVFISKFASIEHINSLQKERHNAATFDDLKMVENELRNEIVKAISEAKFDIIKWMIPFFVTNMGLIIAVLLKIN